MPKTIPPHPTSTLIPTSTTPGEPETQSSTASPEGAPDPSMLVVPSTLGGLVSRAAVPSTATARRGMTQLRAATDRRRARTRERDRNRRGRVSNGRRFNSRHRG